MMNKQDQKKLDWNLIVAIIALIVAIITGFPSVYGFLEDKGVIFPDNPPKNESVF
jgi:hypothetical protein